MAKVYTAVPGAVLSIGTHGMASNEQAAEVPESVAAELAGRADLVIVREGMVAPGAYATATDYAAALAKAATGADFVIPEDASSVEDSPALPAKSATKARKE